MAGAKPGERRGGRQKGTPNKATLEKQALAQQALLETAKKARKTGELKLAIQEMQKALKIAEDFSTKLQPKLIEGGSEKKPTLKIEGDIKLYGEWFDRWMKVMVELAQYQAPKIKAMEAPTPPPDPEELEQQRNAPPRKRFTLRIFEGGKLVEGPRGPDDEEAEA